MSNNILVCIDTSYWQYYTLFGAVSEFMRKHSEEASHWIRDPEEVDQSFLPDLTACATFVKILRKFVMKRLETIDWHLRSHFQDQFDTADKVDIIFAMDDSLKSNFRKSVYPAYKENRRIAKKSYDVGKIHRYIQNVLFPELQVKETYGYHFLRVAGAEGDDVIAAVLKRLGGQYSLKVLIASDRDFLQLSDVCQLNLQGQEVLPMIGEEQVSPQEYLQCKILMGDGSDNIGQVFKKVGAKRALKLVRDKEKLKKMLKESQDAAKQYFLNKKLISFDEMPKELEDKIAEAASKELYSEEAINSQVDFSDFMMM